MKEKTWQVYSQPQTNFPGFRVYAVTPQPWSSSSTQEKINHNKVHNSSQPSQVEYYSIANEKCKRDCCHFTVNPVAHSSPSPMISCIENVPQDVHISRIRNSDSQDGPSNLSDDESSGPSILHDVHISGRLMEDFFELARDNTTNDLETCGILGASLKKETLYVTTLILPKQESSSNSCQALHEEEIFAIQDEHSLLPVGWIHTHPSQSCFMSSVDLHTHYSYQVMVPEAFAIVMAPTDTSRSFGIFRLSDPGGMGVLRDCQEKGFHRHEEPADGSRIYDHCSNVYINPNLRFEIFDLRA